MNEAQPTIFTKSKNIKWIILSVVLAVVFTFTPGYSLSVVSVGVEHFERTYIVVTKYLDKVFISDDARCASRDFKCRDDFAAPYRKRAIFYLGFHLPFAKLLAISDD